MMREEDQLSGDTLDTSAGAPGCEGEEGEEEVAATSETPSSPVRTCRQVIPLREDRFALIWVNLQGVERRENLTVSNVQAKLEHLRRAPASPGRDFLVEEWEWKLAQIEPRPPAPVE